MKSNLQEKTQKMPEMEQFQLTGDYTTFFFRDRDLTVLILKPTEEWLEEFEEARRQADRDHALGKSVYLTYFDEEVFTPVRNLLGESCFPAGCYSEKDGSVCIAVPASMVPAIRQELEGTAAMTEQRPSEFDYWDDGEQGWHFLRCRASYSDSYWMITRDQVVSDALE